MAGKLLLLLGLGAAALAVSAGTAHAESGGGGAEPHPQGFDVNAPPADVLQIIAQAASSGNPTLMRAAADHLDELGYHPQASALRKLADAAQAAQAAIPGANKVPPPANPVNLPGLIITPGQAPSAGSGADPVAARLTAQLNLTDPINSGRTPENAQHDLVTQFQSQEKALGKYTGPLDGLYGPGAAKAVASYGIVPYPPFFWSKNASNTKRMKASFKAAMLAKAAADPTRADEWSHVANAAQNT